MLFGFSPNLTVTNYVTTTYEILPHMGQNSGWRVSVDFP